MQRSGMEYRATLAVCSWKLVNGVRYERNEQAGRIGSWVGF